jgi:hypothetical protein
MALGIPTALCVWSWDHLSSKALIRTVPDRVFVWNDTQRQEAIALHGVPEDRIVVTGAQCFDQWFDRQQSRDRAAFCRRVGLPDDRPFLLWVCSALFRGTADETAFVERWIRALRESGHASLSDVNILIRPHPSHITDWERVDLSRWNGVAIWGANPIDDGSRDDYFDSLYYGAGVTGLNTSAFIEAAIVGRPVYTVLLPELYENQEGTIHFHYLLEVAGGLLHASRSLEEHAVQLDALLTGRVDGLERSRRFVEAFVRPHGVRQASTPQFVGAVEELARSRRAAAVELRDVSTVPLGVRWLAALERGAGRGLLMDARELREGELVTAEGRARRARLAAKAEQRAAKARTVEQRREEQARILKNREQDRLRKRRRNIVKQLWARLGLG